MTDLEGFLNYSRDRLVPLHRGFDGLASSAGARWDQSAAVAHMASCRDKYIDGRCSSDS
jgi:hypothetical protein